MKTGIICFETGQFRSYNTDNVFYAQPLLQFLEQAWHIPYIYRQIASIEDFKYYFKKISQTHFQSKYGIIYFSFHGDSANIQLPTGNVSLNEIAEIATKYDTFNGRHIHFSSCDTLKCDKELIRSFKKETKAETVSGYTACIDCVQSSVNELAYFDQIFQYKTVGTISNHMQNYQEILDKLGFCIF